MYIHPQRIGKDRILKKIIATLGAVLVLGLGCVEEGKTLNNKLFSIDFKAGQQYRYRFVSDREVDLRLSNSEKDKAQKSSEKLDMVIAYEILDTDLYGISSVKATCESVVVDKVSVSKRESKKADVVESLAGKSWQFKVNSLGQIQDYSELEQLVCEMGANSITTQGNRRLKEPDMIDDFIATQWFMWDPVASIRKPLKGVAAGESWDSYLTIPFSRRLPGERAVKYTLLADTEASAGDISRIKADYKLEKIKFDESKKALPNLMLPDPYEGSFQMRGMFGFLANYQITDLSGGGDVVFDNSRGLLVSHNQEYKMDVVASFLFPLGNSVPELSIKQTITVDLIEE